MDITTFGRVAESIFRSINNLLEHFHQSFFFYLLLAPRKFVSIGTYLPAAILVSNSFSLMSIDIFLNWPRPQCATFARTVLVSFVVNGAAFALCGFLGYLVLVVPGNVANATLLGIIVAGFTLPIFLRSTLKVMPDWLPFTYAVTMILQGLFLTTIAMLNFSLSLTLGLFTMPLSWIRPGMSLPRGLMLLLLGCPLSGLYVLSGVRGIPVGELVEGLLWAWSGLHVWTWVAIVGFWLPAWLMAVLALGPPASPSISPEKKNQ
jgi:glycosylphosphatidylinositol transamidase